MRWRPLVSTILSLASAAVAGIAGNAAATRLRGVNRSDLGVVMWSHGHLAILGGAAVLGATAAVLLWGVRRAVGGPERWPSAVGAVASLAVLGALLVGWLASYG